MRLLQTPPGARLSCRKKDKGRAGLQRDSGLGSQGARKGESRKPQVKGKPPSRPLCSPSTEQFLILLFKISLRYIRILVNKSPNSKSQ